MFIATGNDLSKRRVILMVIMELVSATGLEEAPGSTQLFLCSCQKVAPWILSYKVTNKLVGGKGKGLLTKWNKP